MSKVAKLTESFDFRVAADENGAHCSEIRVQQEYSTNLPVFSLHQDDVNGGEDIVMFTLPQMRALHAAFERIFSSGLEEEEDEFA